jgi:hypothetical protein
MNSAILCSPISYACQNTMALPSLSSKLLKANLPTGTFLVQNAWDNGLSNYTVIIRKGIVLEAFSKEKDACLSVRHINEYLSRGFDLLGSLSASVSYPREMPWNEEFMMGID